MNKLFLVTLVVVVLFGTGFLFIPGPLVVPFGLVLDTVSATFGRLFGCSLIGFAIVLWFARKSDNAEFKKAMVYSLFAYYLISAILIVVSQLNGLMNSLGWSLVGLHVILAGCFGYFMVKMADRQKLTRILAIGGTVLVWFPIVAPLLLGVAALFTRHRFLLDYLMPAELFPLVLVGGGLLLWAALRSHRRRVLIIWSLVSAVVLLVGTQGLAVVTGLASGRTEATGWPFTLVMGGMIGFILAVLAIGVGGALLIRDLFKPGTSLS
jgi:hypothetical protein